MTASTTVGTSSSSVYTTPAFWERLWRTAGIQSVGLFILAYLVYGYQPQVGAPADALVAFYDGGRTRILIAAVLSGLAVLNLMVRRCAQDHVGGCGARRLGRGRDRLQRRGRRAVPPAHDGGRGPGILDRRLRKSDAHIGNERLRVGRRRVDCIPARDADHGRVVRALAGRADLEHALRGGGRRRRAHLAWRHHLARWILGTGRSLFALRLADHRPRVDRGREPRPLDPKPRYACWMVMPTTRATTADSNTTAPTRFLRGRNETYAYRRFGSGPVHPLLCLQHFMGTLDNWDPSVADPLASGREVILFDNAGRRPLDRYSVRHCRRNGGARPRVSRRGRHGDV